MVHCPRCKRFYRNKYTLKLGSKYPKPICISCRITLLIPDLEKSKLNKKYMESRGLL